MPSLSRFAGFLLGHLSLGGIDPWPSQYAIPSRLGSSDAQTCPINSPISCHNSTVIPDSCCFIYPGGHLLSTQFWDTNPAVGPADSWTLHGLWPDLCDGSYPQYCSAAPTYYNITSIISASSAELYDFMTTYWLPDRGSAEHFWQHEWNKHGTCINTLAPSCYAAGYKAGDEVVDFFQRAVDLFKQLNSYDALASADILPSYSKTYTASAIQDALQNLTGNSVVIGCRGNQLNQAWYSFNVKGNLQAGEFIPTAPLAQNWKGNCPETGIRYLPKSRSRSVEQ
ncbi:hypothetical protein K3495_g10730 [Podosphaera aphanis]|nr:hypothetical protein K3495_g10730 [Podosphaera aphanis]